MSPGSSNFWLFFLHLLYLVTCSAGGRALGVTRVFSRCGADAWFSLLCVGFSGNPVEYVPRQSFALWVAWIFPG